MVDNGWLASGNQGIVLASIGKSVTKESRGTRELKTGTARVSLRQPELRERRRRSLINEGL